MDVNRIVQLLNRRASEAKIYILKGFTNDVLMFLGKSLLDYEYFIDGKINISNINGIQIFAKVLAAPEGTQFMTMESFLALSSSIRALDGLGKSFCIVENNLLYKIKNPSNVDIPDFESQEFQFSDGNEVYSLYYSFCVHDQLDQYVTYGEPDLIGVSCVERINFLEGNDTDSIIEPNNGDTHTLLSGEDNSLQNLLERIYYGNIPNNTSYQITRNVLYKKLVRVLSEAIQLFGLNISLYWQTEVNSTINVRSDLQETLNNIWGFESFRELQMYKDLNFGRQIRSVSQGEIIETVVAEAENAINGREFRNVLLTSPTGAGKSLLFQLSAIYLATEYNALTIIVSPLLALMEDQVNNLQPLYKQVAALNSNKSAAESSEILQRVQEGEINILYLAPELLLSHSMNSLVGTRRVGLVVIDEAHTVTTWGRDFRVDYWFLGDYLRTSKRYLNYSFPIFALTATAVWDPERKNDMVFETISSLNMDPCTSFIGVVRRENIEFEIGRPQKVRDYEAQRRGRTSQAILEALDKGRKTIVYFPYVSTIKKMLQYPDLQDCRLKITEYHSKMTPVEKMTNAGNFKSGQCPIICASKAFGMGVDVSDITEVYHHAPTGGLTDYIQEIGRLARDPQLLGLAKIDFNEQDFKYTRQLHGLSTIKPYELERVLRKLMEIYEMRGEKRNMLLSPSDFEYIFINVNDKDELDQKFKSCLLLISHDLSRSLLFPALIVRAKNIFADVYIKVAQGDIFNFFNQYKDFLEIIDRDKGYFILKGEKLWTAKFRSYSFPQFKSRLMKNQIFRSLQVSPIFKIELNLKDQVELTKVKLQRFFKDSEKILENLCQATAGEPRHIKYKELKDGLIGYSQVEKEAFLHSFILTYATPVSDTNDYVCCQVKIKEDEDLNQISILRHGYESVKSQIMSAFNNTIYRTEESFFCDYGDIRVRMVEILDMLSLASFQRLGGADPQVFVRINNPDYLRDVLSAGEYKNKMLINIYERYKFSEEIFTYFFNTDMTNQQRWDFIEEYFLGASKERLLHFAD